MRIYIKLGYLTKLFCIDSKEPIITKKSFVLVEGPPQYIYIYCKRRAKKAESDAATMEPTTGKATVAEEAPGAGAGDSMVAAVAELTSTTETKRATKKLLIFFIAIISFLFILWMLVLCFSLCDGMKVKVVKVFILLTKCGRRIG